MVMKNKYCPCCGDPIMVGQEECLNCRVYLWEVGEHGVGGKDGK
jgi:hypothetical protein